ncbi:calpain-1 catalytic subunit-like [Parambassis ranga]|uniref:Calpain-1 catalytic subunit-like n=1 Tax=Parambassis ranga TaxID=210632 RepID=A0A6P7JM99_9TELE|nr:calpain-1 catalytic subunit-like [Parambassis ranga]
MTSTCIRLIHSFYESGGEGSLSNLMVKFKGQDYRQLKEAPLREGRKFVDEKFPANLSSLGKLENMTAEQMRGFKWLRPPVSNCWFLSSIGVLNPWWHKWCLWNKVSRVCLKPLDIMFETSTSIINLRYQDGSEGSPSNPTKFKNQDYAQLKDNSLRGGQLFVDSSFPPELSSLGDLKILKKTEPPVTWLRPADILKAQNRKPKPVFLYEGASRFDFGQGDVGDCWFLAAISTLTFQEKLLAQVVPMEQTFDNNYAGIFHFRFWRFGKWVDVVIDDLLPTRNKNFLSVKFKGSNEFWAPLLEKAYAKVCGSYADMDAGWSTEAFKDFTGGVSMMYDLKDAQTCEEMWLSLTRATSCKSMMCCSTDSKKDSLENSVSETGLVYKHAYSVTGVTEVTYTEMESQSKQMLVRVMNPWGKQEWSRQWSDESDMWQKVSPEDREKCDIRNDGEFWMPLEDFCHYFRVLYICCENPNFLDGDLTCQWKSMSYDGSWVAGGNAGADFATNPQYRVQVAVINKQESNDHNVLLSLMQVPQQGHRKQEEYYTMKLQVYKVPPGTPQGRLPSSIFKKPLPSQSTKNLSLKKEREIVKVYSLEPGEYVIVPSIKDVPQTNTEFVLTVYTKADAKTIPTGAKEETIFDVFNHYADQNSELSHRQLQKLLNDRFPHGTFDLDTCRSMIAMVDQDQRMTMTITEFSALWKKIEEYKNLFYRSDTNKNGALSDQEIQNAIKAAGMDVNDATVKMMISRYSDSGSTILENFISLMVRLDKMSSVFNNNSTDGVITFNRDEWSNIFMYN